ncbi:S8 family serine peptidase, partial [Bacillus sp. LL01]|uniref:S8 family serine peptidase n=1 Tax=Bacillus sp. LL01 TaxID=1665556 RepID=UPI0024109889
MSSVFPERPPSVEQPAEDEWETTVVIVTVKEDVDEAVKEVMAQVPSGKLRKTFKRIYNGFSIELKKGELNLLKNVESVERVDHLASYETNLDGSVPFIGGDQVRGMFNRNGERLTGKGVKVAVIDTGIDYRHPDLQGNYKGGYDVVDYDDDPMETQ